MPLGYRCRTAASGGINKSKLLGDDVNVRFHANTRLQMRLT
jgi:hypothetical protein